MDDKKIIKILVTDGQKKLRIDKFLSNQLENKSRSKVQEIIEAGGVLVNDKPVKNNYQVIPGDEVAITLIRRNYEPSDKPEDIPISIIYEDDSLLIINKEAGMVTHPAYSNYSGTLVNALLFHTNNLSTTGTKERPGIVHRIDKGTSGLLVIAKNDFAHKFLADQFHEHSTEREYHAIVWGNFSTKKKIEKSGTIETFLDRSKSDRKKFSVSETGKRAVTHYEVLEEFENFAYLKLRLETGRTHQIRVHLSHNNHPILCDPTYGGRKMVYGAPSVKYKAFINNILELTPYQILHAKTLGFIHPETRKFMRFDSELPPVFQEILTKIRNYTEGKK
jgi:23S rRNA pseudouridine1911/1915/1917 synthase